MKQATIKVELSHNKITLTNSRGDTFVSKSEELTDFIMWDAKESESPVNQDQLWQEVVRLVRTEEGFTSDLINNIKSQFIITKR